jgi:hypothetical protein
VSALTEEEAGSPSVEALAERSPFFKLWIPSHLVFIACSLGTYGLNWWLAQSPGGTRVLGPLAAVSALVGLVVVVALAGAIDRSHRLKLLLSLEGVTAGSSALLVICYLAGPASSPAIALGALGYVLVYSTQLVYQAGLETTLADLAPRRWPMTRTAALIQIQPFTTRFAAALIGGPLLVIGLLWTLPVIAVAGVAVTVLCLLVTPIRFRHQAAAPAAGGGRLAAVQRLGRSLTDAREAWLWIRERPILVFITVTALLNNLLSFPFYALLAVFIGSLHLPHPTAAYGQANLCYGGCLLVASVLFSRFGRPVLRPVLWSLLGELGVVVSLLLATLATSSLFLAACTGLFAVFNVVLASVAGSVWLSLTPADIRVRVFSLRRLSQFATIPVGGTVLGVIGSAYGFSSTLRVLLGVVLAGMVASWLVLRWQRSRGHLA